MPYNTADIDLGLAEFSTVVEMRNLETSPLLSPSSSSSHSASSDVESPPLLTVAEERKVDNDVLPETSTTGRTIGWGSAYVLVISRVIGSGIFAMPGTIVQNVGSPGLALVLWVIGALVAWAGLAIDMEYGCMLPRSGGVKVYLEYTYRKPRFLASTLVAVQAVLLGFTASNCIVFAKYTLFAVGATPGDFNTKLLAVGLLTWITIVHSCFYRTGIWIQNMLGWLKIGLVVFMILTGLFVVIFRPDTSSRLLEIPSEAAWDELFRGSNWEWNNLSTAFFKVLYSYAGLSNINNVLNEVKNPVKTIKTVGPAALLTACVMYVLINIAYLAVVPLEEVKQSRELIAALFFERVFGAGFGNKFLPLAIALSAVGNVMVVTFALARVNQEVARQGFLPFAGILASSKPFGSPMGGLIVHYVPSVLVIVLPPSSTVYSFIADVEGYAGQFFALAVASGLIYLRTRRPDLYRPFKAWIPAVWLRILLCLSLITAPLFPPKKGTADVNFFYATYALVGLVIFVFGIAYCITITMASAAVQQPTGHSTSFEPLTTQVKSYVASQPEKHHVQTKLNYYKDPGDGSRPAPNIAGKPETYDRPSEPLDVTVHDIRGEEDQYTLDKNGFQIYRHASVEKEFLDDEQIKAQYYPEVEQLLKDATGASRVFIFDHTIRRQPKDQRGETPTVNLRGPVNRVHIDQSYSAAKSRVPHHLPDEADKLLKTRYQIINVWRPIKTIYKDPLAVADAHSVPDSDLVGVDLIYPDRRGETYTVRPNPEHKWYYLYGQTPEEVVLIKCFDSKLDGRARRVPHTAFVNPETVDAPARESIEVRTLVFHEDEPAE
ncbi:high affinity methionine permease, partial [Aureobasidium melanogenum]